MPKQRKPPTNFDGHVGNVVDSIARLKNMRQEDLAQSAAIPPSNLGKSIRGVRSFSIKEITRISDVLKTPASEIVDAALKEYGGGDRDRGMRKLIMSDAPPNVTDLHPYLGHVDVPEKSAAMQEDPPEED